MSNKKKIPLGVIYMQGKVIGSDWNFPPQYKDLTEKLREVVAQTIHAYFKAKRGRRWSCTDPKTKDYVA